MNKINTIDEYLSSLPNNQKEKLTELRNIIKSLVPEATEKISYGLPTFFLYKNLVHFGTGKNHIGFYPAPSAIEKFKDKLTNYKTSKGAIQFKYNEALPYDLIKEIVLFRVNENTDQNNIKK